MTATIQTKTVMITTHYTKLEKNIAIRARLLSVLAPACNCSVHGNDPVKFSCQLIMILKTELSDIAIHSAGLAVLPLPHFLTCAIAPELRAPIRAILAHIGTAPPTDFKCTRW